MQPVSNTFETRAAQLGHDMEALQAGHEVASEISIADIDSLKALLHNGQLNTEKKEAVNTTVLSELAAPDINSKTDLQQKVNHFIYGNHELIETDKAAANALLFPMKVLAVSAKTKTINQPTILGTTQQPMVVNYGTLNLVNTGIITIQGVETTFNVDNFVRMGPAPSTMGDINILGVKGQDGYPGGPGYKGPDGMPSSNGGNGSYGMNGSNAMDGMPSMPATINIALSIQSSSPIIVYTTSGAGGKGGNGGKGGAGGNGGTGGYPTIGGTGGNGGDGGRGGNGVNAVGNVRVYVNINAINNVQTVAEIAPAGTGGIGGDGGTGGSGTAQTGSTGRKGNNGSPGATSGTPANIIIRPY